MRNETPAPRPRPRLPDSATCPIDRFPPDRVYSGHGSRLTARPRLPPLPSGDGRRKHGSRLAQGAGCACVNDSTVPGSNANPHAREGRASNPCRPPMAEPHPPADRPPDAAAREPTPAGGNGFAAALGAAPPADDTPTIISKTAPAAAAGAGLVEGLRGKHLAHFELIEPIGVGGMAAVIHARDTQLDRVVALKVLPPEMAADPENVRRFHQEARSAAKLDHENIARVYYCGEDQRLHFIAFEFVEGINLRGLLERRGRLPVAEAVHYLLQIAAGLAHAAARGVVHRDIKPSDIMLSPNGRAKLV